MIRVHIAAGAMLALISLPALAQETSTEATGAISRDALPEVGDQGLADEGGQSAVSELADHSVAAQQFGNLATTKGTSSLIGDLGDVMVLLHSQINDRLKGDGAMDEADQTRLNQLKDMNEQEFAMGLAEWINDAYPEAIEGWKDVQSKGGMQELANAVVTQLEAQLSVAKKIIEADGNLATPDDEVRQTLSWGGGDEEGKVAEQFRMEPKGDEAAGDNVAD